MKGKKNVRSMDSETTVWVDRIKALLEERGISQKALAIESGIPATSISEWLGEKKDERPQRQPKVSSFKKIADALGVTTDYLLGATECGIPENEEIHKKLGLSDKAIKNIVRLHDKAEAGETLAAEKLAVCNFLLETVNRTSLFEFFYNYFLGEYYFANEKQNLGATEIYVKTPNRGISKKLNFAETYTHVYLSLIIQELSTLKKVADKIRLKKQKADYFEWLKTPEGIAFERECWEAQPDYEDVEE